MCIAVLNKGPKLDRKTLETMWQSNPQGGGLMYVDKNTKELVTYKTMFDKKMFWEYDLAKHRAKDGVVVLHFRIATQGFQEHNLHPFVNNKKNLGFVHNGIISQYCSRGHVDSDTLRFHQDVVQGLDASFVYDEDLLGRMEEFVGAYNKLIFMNLIGHTAIVNESSGIWVGDDWFSNDGFKTRKHYYGHRLFDNQGLLEF